eukprot:gene26907-35603_t
MSISFDRNSENSMKNLVDDLEAPIVTLCVFAETRPPPVGSSNDRLEAKKSRGEILGDCKKQCATTKEQLLIGAPKKKAAE